VTSIVMGLWIADLNLTAEQAEQDKPALLEALEKGLDVVEVNGRRYVLNQLNRPTPPHDWLLTGHETLACQFPGCGKWPAWAEFDATHVGPVADSLRTSRESFCGHGPVIGALRDWLDKLSRSQINPNDVSPEELSAAWNKLNEEVARLG